MSDMRLSLSFAVVLAAACAALPASEAQALQCDLMSERESRMQSDFVLDAVIVGPPEGSASYLDLVQQFKRAGPDLATVRADPLSLTYNTFQSGRAKPGEAWRIYAKHAGDGEVRLTLCARSARLHGKQARAVSNAVAEAAHGAEPVAAATPTSEPDGRGLNIVPFLGLGAVILGAVTMALFIRSRRARED